MHRALIKGFSRLFAGSTRRACCTFIYYISIHAYVLYRYVRYTYNEKKKKKNVLPASPMQWEKEINTENQ